MTGPVPARRSPAVAVLDDHGGAAWASVEQELADLLDVLDQSPVGLLELDDTGAVTRINPAGARLLAPLWHGTTDLVAALAPVAPGPARLVRQTSGPLGPVPSTERLLVPLGGDPERCLELLLVRPDPGRLLVTVIDVSAERRLAAREHTIAVTLQQSLLGRIDPVRGLPVSHRYQVADVERHIGGDWYDVIDLPHSRVGLVIGDAVGHGLEAAAAMGQVRGAVRSLSSTCPDPAEVLRHTEAFALGVAGAACTTCTYAVLDRNTGLLTHATAGHPPPLVLRADGTAEFLWEGRDLPLACDLPVTRHAARDLLDPDDTLVLYTDGLVERRRTSIDDDLERLRQAATGQQHLDVDTLATHLLDTLLPDAPATDDVCLLAVRHAPVLDLDLPRARDGGPRTRHAAGTASSGCGSPTTTT